jgi:hypothetical protein
LLAAGFGLFVVAFLVLVTADDPCVSGSFARVRCGGIVGLASCAALIGGGVQLFRSRTDTNTSHRRRVIAGWGAVLIGGFGSLVGIFSVIVLDSLGSLCAAD